MGKILIVDDDPDLIEACRPFLGKEGHETASAGNVAEGKRAIEGEKLDLLILDMMMEQGDDGIVMARELRRKGFARPTLMLTGISRAMVRQFDKDEDMIPVNAFLEKSVAPKTLVASVGELLSKREEKQNVRHRT